MTDANFYCMSQPANAEVMSINPGIRFGKKTIFTGKLQVKKRGAASVLPKPENTVLLIECCPSAVAIRNARPHFKDGVIWVGADGAGLIDQQGSWPNSRKKQIFALEADQKILFFDSQKVVARITAQTCGAPPLLERAEVTEVADYILTQEQQRGTSPKTLIWCWLALLELGSQPHIREFFGKHSDIEEICTN